MTSREALKTLTGYLGLIDLNALELLVPIAKDLEALEIIKKHIINDRVAYLGWEDLEENEYEIIKEWLENE